MELPLQALIIRINQSDDTEINEIMNAIRQRYRALHPDWEVIHIYFPKHDPVGRQQLLDYLIRFLSA